MADVTLNATNDTLELGVVLDLDQASIERLNLTVQWYRNQSIIGQGLTFVEPVHNCQQPNSTFSDELCALNGTVGPYETKVVIFDDAGFVEIKWQITYTVWHPPVVEEEENSTIQTNESEKGMVVDSNLIILILSVIVAILSVVLVLSRRQNSAQQPQARPKQAPQMFVPPPMYSDVPAAPDFSQMGEYVPPSKNEWDSTNRWK